MNEVLAAHQNSPTFVVPIDVESFRSVELQVR
jgi:hypothetical protein